MKKIQGKARPGRVSLAFAAAGTAAAIAAFSLSGGERPELATPPGGGLAAQLAALRGANDLVRARSVAVGRDPALYPTAYGRLEAALGGSPPPVAPEALAKLARDDLLDTPAWRAHYVCLALEDAGAAKVLDRAGIREAAEREALRYLRAPDAEDTPLTSLTTRASFLRTLTCLGRPAPRTAVARLASDAAHSTGALSVLYALDALRAAGKRAEATAVRAKPFTCDRSDYLNTAASALLHGTRPEDCLRSVLKDEDPQTRWLARRALGDAADSPPADDFLPNGLVAKNPEQLGTLTATYEAARALAAAGRTEQAPEWLKRKLRVMGGDDELVASDRVLLAMTCHRLALSCGPQAARGAREAGELPVPARLTPANERRWYGAMLARAEFGRGCPRTAVALPATALTPAGLRLVAVLAANGCAADVRRLTRGTDLGALAGTALRRGELPAAADAYQAALVAGQDLPAALFEAIPEALRRYRDPRHPELYAPAPGGEVSAAATRAAYFLLA